jgi:alkylation response protein AidB-like acyl-CoA dehydrogenase
MLTRSGFRALSPVTRRARQLRCFSTSFNDNRYGLSEEQSQLADMCEQFSTKELKPHAAKWDEQKIFPVEALRKAAGLGLGGMFVSEQNGGSGFSRFDGSLVFEELSKGCTSTTAYLSIHNMCAWMVSEFGTEDQRKRYLPQLISMDWFASYCLTEPSSGSDAGSLRTTAKKRGSEYVLNGTKAFISGGSTSNLYLIMARTGTQESGPKGVTCFAVEAGTKGLSFGAQEKKLGWNTQPTCMVILEDAVIPEANRIGQEGEGFKVAMKGLDGGRLSIAACSIGAAKACYDAAVEHVKVRQQFGKPLSTFQNVQFKIADMGANIHLSRLAVRHAATLLDAKDPNATVYCAMAKKTATELCFDVCDQALQLFGGYGYLKDYPIERYLRDARVHRILEGTNEVQQMIMSRDALK